MKRRALGVLWMLGALLAGFSLYKGSSVFLQAIPWGVESALANAIDVFPRHKTCDLKPADDALLQQMVARLQRPGDSFPLQVQVVRDHEKNAFATLGARVYILSGILREMESPEELAGVLAHEIEHVRRRHVLQGAFIRLLSQVVLGDESVMSVFMRLDFSQSQEAEADRGAMDRLLTGHISPEGLMRFFERRSEDQAPTFLSTHPPHQERAALARMALRHYDALDERPLMQPSQWAHFQTLCAD